MGTYNNIICCVAKAAMLITVIMYIQGVFYIQVKSFLVSLIP